MKILVVAPHADDETLGCGGTLARFRHEQPNSEIHWLLVTEMNAQWGYSATDVQRREAEISEVAKLLSPLCLSRLHLRPAHLDTLPLADLIRTMHSVIFDVQPDTVFVPWRHDAHSDHAAVFDAVMACVKTFRAPFVRQVLAYETLSETDFSLDPGIASFRPNVWIDISSFLETKLALLRCYASEISDFPFPRSVEAVEALARLRGASAGVEAAEGFVLLRGLV